MVYMFFLKYASCRPELFENITFSFLGMCMYVSKTIPSLRGQGRITGGHTLFCEVKCKYLLLFWVDAKVLQFPIKILKLDVVCGTYLLL